MTLLTSPIADQDSAQPGFSPAEIASFSSTFAEQGYLVLRNMVPADKLARLNARLLEEFERAQAAGLLFNGGGRLSGHLNCFPGQESRFVYETLKERGVIDLVRTLMPNAVREPNVGMNFNLPGSVTQHYHTDLPFTKEFIIINIAVVDANLQNGATEVTPGTHKQFYPYWRWELERPYRNSVRVQTKQGDILIRTSNLWHRGMPNKTNTPRPMMALTWEDGGSHLEDTFAVEGGKITFRPNWFRPSKLGRIRERVFVGAPVTYSAYRFVDSIVTNKGYA